MAMSYIQSVLNSYIQASAIRVAYFQEVLDGDDIPSEKRFKSVWARIHAFEESTGKSIDTPLAREDYIALYTSIGARNINSFSLCKTIITHYLDHLFMHNLPGFTFSLMQTIRSIGFQDLDSFEAPRLLYHVNFKALNACIDQTIIESGVDDERRFLLHRTALYLAWFGIELEDAADLKRAFIPDDADYVLLSSGRFVPIPSEAMQYIRKFRDYSGGQRKYVFSEYLFRSSANHHLSALDIRNYISRFNKYSNRRFSLSYDTVFFSGILYRAYQKELTGECAPPTGVSGVDKFFGMKIDGREQARKMRTAYDAFKNLSVQSRDASTTDVPIIDLEAYRNSLSKTK